MSSSNPDEVALTMKGMAIAAVPAVMGLLGVAHVVANVPILDQQSVIDAINASVAVVATVLLLVAKGVALFGIVRKMWNTVFSK